MADGNPTDTKLRELLREIAGAPAAPPPHALRDGTRVGPYEVLSLLGKGGMGEVYRARDTRLGREVAIKVLSQARLDGHGRARFLREAQLASAVSHPNVLDLHDVGEHEGQPYLVAELLQGRTLRELVAAGPTPWPAAAGLVLQAAEGLAAAHEKGIVHRDLKPDNLFLTAAG